MSIKKSKKTSSFRGRVSANAKKSTRSGGGKSYLVLPKGITQLMLEENTKKINLDFLPYVVNDKKHPDGIAVGDFWYRRPYKLHRNIGADNKNYICLSSIGKKCPICEVQKELFDSDKKAAIALYPKSRVLYSVIPKNSKKHEEIPFVWDMAESLFHDTLKDVLEENEEYEIFPDLDEGLTVKCSLKWKPIGDGKPFPEVIHVDFEERDPYDESVLEKSANLDDIITNSVLSYEALKAAFLEIEEDEEGGKLSDEDEDEEDEKPVRSKKPIRKPEPEEDEDEDDEDEKPVRSKKPITKKPIRKPEPEEDEDEDDEDEKPVKKPVSKVSKSKTKVTEPEEDDVEVEEEEDEDEKPVKQIPASSSKYKPAKKKDDEDEKEDEEEDEEEDEPEIPKKARCVACQGTGKNSRGKTCPICNGTGRKPEPEEDEDDDVPATKITKKKEPLATPNTKTKPLSKEKCSFGHRFGVDAEKFDDCDDCVAWSACEDLKEKIGKK